MTEEKEWEWVGKEANFSTSISWKGSPFSVSKKKDEFVNCAVIRIPDYKIVPTKCRDKHYSICKIRVNQFKAKKNDRGSRFYVTSIGSVIVVILCCMLLCAF